MDKSSRDSRPSKLVQLVQDDSRIQPEIDEIKKLQVDSESKVPYTKSMVSVKIRSRFDARLEYTGQATGKQYLWSKAGSVVLVDVEDSEILLAKHIGDQLCCGNSPETNKVFELVS
jgi:hypothetical protein